MVFSPRIPVKRDGLFERCYAARIFILPLPGRHAAHGCADAVVVCRSVTICIFIFDQVLVMRGSTFSLHMLDRSLPQKVFGEKQFWAPASTVTSSKAFPSPFAVSVKKRIRGDFPSRNSSLTVLHRSARASIYASQIVNIIGPRKDRQEGSEGTLGRRERENKVRARHPSCHAPPESF